MNSMKKVKHLMAVLAVAALLFLLPTGYSLTLKVSAAEPITYSVKYVPDLHQWRFQAGTSTFDDNAYHRELYYLYQALKEGDLVVVYNDSTESTSLDLGTTHLGNLTVASSKAFSVIYSGDIDDCYILAGAACSVNADVKNAYVYDSVVCNFNKNVEELKIYVSADKMSSILGCGGTVKHLYAVSTSGSKVFYDLSNFEAASLNIQNGVLQTSSEKYGQTPVEAITEANFDYTRYANEYPDLKATFGYDAKALYNHYITNGINEKRKAYTIYGDFDYTRYANDYPDLKAAYGSDAVALYNHYITLGISEKRVAYAISGKVYK